MPEEFEDTGGSLADAIAEHLALKKDHGGDAVELEHELEEALAPPTREVEPAAEVPVEAPPVEVPPAPEPSVPEEPVEPPSAPEPELDPEPVAQAEPEPEPKPGPTAQTETTGTIEFEWDKTEEPAADMSGSESNEHDLLEDTPDFFEETPEHDKLWFDEAPPRKFEF